MCNVNVSYNVGETLALSLSCPFGLIAKATPIGQVVSHFIDIKKKSMREDSLFLTLKPY